MNYPEFQLYADEVFEDDEVEAVIAQLQAELRGLGRQTDMAEKAFTIEPSAVLRQLAEERLRGWRVGLDVGLPRRDDCCPECVDRYGYQPIRINGSAPTPWAFMHPGHECHGCHDAGRMSPVTGEIALCRDPVHGHRPAGHELPAITREDWNREAAVPVRFRDATLRSWTIGTYRTMGFAKGDPLTPIRRWVKSWPPPAPFLSLIGQPGVGKTHLAVGAAWEVRDSHGVRVRIYRMEEILDLYRSTMRPEASMTKEEVDGIIDRVPLLVLDDLSAGESGTDWAIDRVLSVVNKRYDDMKPTIVTANRVGLDERTYRRLTDEGAACAVEFER